MARDDRFLPDRAPITAYGGGGFRFADMSHQGSLLITPGGMRAWAVSAADEVDMAALDPLWAEADRTEVFLLGCGAARHQPASDLARAFAERDIVLEAMDTGAACRTYNVLLAEGRAVTAGLIAVD